VEEILNSLLSELPQRVLAVLIARRHDLDDRHRVAVVVSNDKPIGPAGVVGGLRLGPMADLQGLVDDRVPGRLAVPAGLGGNFERDNMRLGPAGLLFRKGEIIRGQEATVKRVAEGADLALVKVMKPARTDSRPVVNGHG
jgi:hypothetical protein